MNGTVISYMDPDDQPFAVRSEVVRGYYWGGRAMGLGHSPSIQIGPQQAPTFICIFGGDLLETGSISAS